MVSLMRPVTSQPRIAIIGAGIAGLSCARVLADAGCHITVFEKSRGPGGRMSTRRRLLQDHWQCDHGAQYFTATHPDFVAQTAQWLAAGCLAPWPARLHVFGPHQHSNKPAPQRYVGIPRMTAPAHHLAQGLHMLCNTRVTGAHRTAHGWCLHGDTDALPGEFDWLILAIPAQQAEALLTTLQDVEGCTTLLAASRQFPLQPCWALMAELRSPLAVDFDAAFVNHDPDHTGADVLSWVARDSSKPQRPAGETWLLHASETWSIAHLEADHEQVYAAMLDAWTDLLGQRPPVEHWQLQRWRYARQAPGTHGPGHLLDSSAQLGLCGDWLHGGRVEGAWLSGRTLAQQLLQQRLPACAALGCA